MNFGKKPDLRMINTTSKMSLKMSCLGATRGDVRLARDLYDYLADGIESLPDFDLQPPTVMDQVRSTVGGIFGWVKENKGDIMQAWDFIRNMRAASPANPIPSDIPPIPKM